jgi:peptide/nickel transport system permease protein
MAKTRDDESLAPDVTGVVESGALLAEAAPTIAARDEVDFETAPQSQWQLFRRRFLRHKLAVAALLVLVVLAGLAILAPAIAPSLPTQQSPDILQQPSGDHLLGTDELGRDTLSRLLYAARISLLVGFLVGLFSTLIGTSIGAIAGYYGGWLDMLLMRFTDLFLVLPGLALLMIAQRGLQNKELWLVGQVDSKTLVVFTLAFLFWQTIARVVRGVFLSLKEKEYVEAAKASGASSGRIILRHMLPNIVGPILVNLTLIVGVAIISESTLSFLGFGVQIPDASWGNMLEQSRGWVGTDNAYLIYFPGLAILLTVLAVNFLGDGLRDAFDPQSKH